LPEEGQLVLAGGTGTSSDEDELGLSREQVWLFLPNV